MECFEDEVSLALISHKLGYLPPLVASGQPLEGDNYSSKSNRLSGLNKPLVVEYMSIMEAEAFWGRGGSHQDQCSRKRRNL